METQINVIILMKLLKGYCTFYYTNIQCFKIIFIYTDIHQKVPKISLVLII